MKVAISGASGFVGRNICSLLESFDSYQVIPLDIITGIDLENITECDEIEEFDVFLHLANLAYVPASYENPELFYRTNYLTTLNALELCRKYKAKFVYVSSYVYGSPQYLPVDESHPVTPFNPYAQTKVICESLCEGYHRDFKIPVIVLRPFNIYGVGQTGNLLIPEIIQQLKEGKTTVHLKDASPKRDYVNVLDIAIALKACVDSGIAEHRTYNLCSGKSYSVLELTEIVNSILKSKVVFEFSITDRPNEVNDARGCNMKIFNELGWKPNVDLLDGIKAIIEYEKL